MSCAAYQRALRKSSYFFRRSAMGASSPRFRAGLKPAPAPLSMPAPPPPPYRRGSALFSAADKKRGAAMTTDLRSEQRGVATGVVIALVAAAVVLGAGWTILPFTPPRVVMPGERLAYAIRVDLFVMMWLLIAIARVGNIRFFSADDIRGSGFAPPSPRLAMASAFLQNTLEQVALAIPAH